MIQDAKIKYDSGLAYYNNLKTALIAHENLNSLKFSPLNYEDVLLSLDIGQPLKNCICGIYYILIRKYREAITQNRKRKSNNDNDDGGVVVKKKGSGTATTNGNVDTSSSATNGMNGNTKNLYKSVRYNAIPQVLHQCNSIAAKVALLLYGVTHQTDSVKRDLLYMALQNQMKDKSIADIIEMCQAPAADLRSYIKAANVSSTEEDRKVLILSLIELSAMTKDRLCSKLAYEISNTGYISIIGEYMRKYNLNELTVFEPLINKYIHDCIPLVQQEHERQIIYNQFKEGAKSVIQDLIEKIPPPRATKQLKERVKKLSFENDQVYDYYRGAQNFARDIVNSTYKHDGRMYYIQTYNDCLYDVIGYTNYNVTTNGNNSGDTKNASDTNKQSQDEIFLKRLSWQERLDQLPFRTKVKIMSDTGKALNELSGTYDIAISSTNKETGVINKRIIKRRK